MAGSAYERLRAAAADLAALLAALEAALPYREQRGYRDAPGPAGKVTPPLASWNTPVAMVILGIHAGVRELESGLRYRAAGVLRARGGSDANTAAAIESVLSLAAGAGDAPLAEAARALERWCWQARLALGEREPWLQLPRLPGAPPPRCPWCACHTLRHKPLAGIVRCVNPACRDDDGARPLGRVELGAYSGEMQLIWQDGSQGIDMPGAGAEAPAPNPPGGR